MAKTNPNTNSFFHAFCLTSSRRKRNESKASTRSDESLVEMEETTAFCLEWSTTQWIATEGEQIQLKLVLAGFEGSSYLCILPKTKVQTRSRFSSLMYPLIEGRNGRTLSYYVNNQRVSLYDTSFFSQNIRTFFYLLKWPPYFFSFKNIIIKMWR